MKNIILMRHGTAEKNKRNEHGGAGSSLTEEGVQEIESTGRRLKELNVPIDIVYTVNRPQCTESAFIFSNIYNVRCKVLDSIEPYNLGLLDGLSEEQANIMHPDISKRMDLWRQGEIDISQLNIPGSTNPLSFVESCSMVLGSINIDNSLVVATRSILVAFASILLLRRPIQGGGYVEIPWNNSSFTIFNECKGIHTINTTLSTNLISN